MLIRGDIHIVDSRVRIFDVDGSYIQLTVEDALFFAAWVRHNTSLLQDIQRRTERLAEEGHVDDDTQSTLGPH